MKKAFDQTVRDLKREVNKKVLKIPGIEQKILDATSNEPWGPHGSLLADIAQATRNYQEYQIIMAVIWKRINGTRKNWRHVYKGLSVLEYLVAHGSERVIDDIREHAHQILTLSDFQYIDSSGKDQGSNVRRKSQSLVALVNDKARIQEVRQKAYASREKYHNTLSTGGMHRPRSYSGSAGYGDRYDDEHCVDHYGNRDDDRNRYRRDRDNKDVDRYGRGGDLNNQGSDRCSRESDECCDRNSYRESECKEKRGNNNHHFGTRNRSIEGDRDHSFDEDHQHASRRLECKSPDKTLGAPPSYEEAIGEQQNHVQDERDGGVQSPPRIAPSSPSPKASSPESVDHAQTLSESGAALSHIDKQIDAFDEFDPRSCAAATAPARSSFEADIFGLSAVDTISSLDVIPVTADSSSLPHVPNSLDLGTDFGTVSSASNVFNQIGDNPFENNPFHTITQDNNSLSQQQNLPPVPSFQLPIGSMSGSEPPQPVAQNMQSITSFDFGDSFHATTPSVMNPSSPSDFLPPELAAPPDTVAPGSILPHMETTITMPTTVFQPGTSATIEMPQTNILSQPAQSASQTYAANSLSQTGLTASVHLEASPLSTNVFQPGTSTTMEMPQTHTLSQPAQSASQAYAASSIPQTGLSASIHPGASPYSLSPWGAAAAPPVSQSFSPSHLSQPGQSVLTATQADAPNMLSQLGLSVSTASAMLSQPGLSAATMVSQAAPSTLLSQPELPPPLVSQAGPSTILSQPGLSASGASQPNPPSITGPPAKSMQQEEKFEPKSTVWADTLSRGLVNLNISGPKTNPLADIGIDFDSINRREKRKEEKSSAAPVSTIVMGKAMGAGSGLGRAGAGGLVPPLNPMMGSGMGMGMGNGGMSMGMGMSGGYGGGMNPPVGMGIGMGVNMGMGMGANLGMAQGTPMPPVQPPNGMGLPQGPAMSGYAYNPMMGMGGPGGSGPPQQYGGYR